MTSREGFGPSKVFACTLGVVTALSVFVLASPSAVAEEGFSGPTFRKGMWRFVRTLEIATSSNVRQKLLEREMTRCVDPTQAMKATFSSPSVGNCHSSRPEKINNKYVFSNRCDYLGPVSTVITVLSDEAYTEVNKTNVGQAPRTDRVVARRISDCHEDRASLGRPAAEPGELPLQQDGAEGEPL
ncbi:MULTISPECIES: DUF3617 domain-containing protein [unclassified Bradyrhizobium]|uniref:DUF3617 domain-containing protein n=1 Tax=unclassified Bradyrhizobium TaxID=2631580 RepID=UPI0003F72BC0|nr:MULTISPECIES: DUF3617 family protein [unclassified Bradyrhizobium]QIG98978.1 hypothetical protein G6P99_46870 [Bradyrhizobium sp. 6(2017)]